MCWWVRLVFLFVLPWKSSDRIKSQVERIINCYSFFSFSTHWKKKRPMAANNTWRFDPGCIWDVIRVGQVGRNGQRPPVSPHVTATLTSKDDLHLPNLYGSKYANMAWWCHSYNEMHWFMFLPAPVQTSYDAAEKCQSGVGDWALRPSHAESIIQNGWFDHNNTSVLLYSFNAFYHQCLLSLFQFVRVTVVVLPLYWKSPQILRICVSWIGDFELATFGD